MQLSQKQRGSHTASLSVNTQEVEAVRPFSSSYPPGVAGSSSDCAYTDVCAVLRCYCQRTKQNMK